MVRRDTHHTLSKDSEEYLKEFSNQSKIIDEALEFHKNKDKMIVKNIQPSELKKVRLEI